MSTSPLTLDHLVLPRIKGERVLDVACGFGKWGFLVKKYFWNTENGDPKRQPYLAGLDCYAPNLEALKRHSLYDELVEGRAEKLPFPDKSFDTVLAMEVLEHMREEDGYRALDEFERVARGRIMISTPNKPCFRGGAEDFTGYNEYEAHLSWWKIKMLKKRGYRCYGVGSKLWPARFWNIVEFTYLSYRIPVIADTLLGVKEMT